MEDGSCVTDFGEQGQKSKERVSEIQVWKNRCENKKTGSKINCDCTKGDRGTMGICGVPLATPRCIQRATSEKKEYIINICSIQFDWNHANVASVGEEVRWMCTASWGKDVQWCCRARKMHSHTVHASHWSENDTANRTNVYVLLCGGLFRVLRLFCH